MSAFVLFFLFSTDAYVYQSKRIHTMTWIEQMKQLQPLNNTFSALGIMCMCVLCAVHRDYVVYVGLFCICSVYLDDG